MTKIRKLIALLPASAIAMATTLATVPAASAETAPADTAPVSAHTLHVVKTPTCGCCAAWIDLAREHGFTVTVTDTNDYVAMKRQADVPEPFWACHTTTIDGYTVEGHVPFAAIDKLLSERPAVSGIAVPGMPAGSPGMGTNPSAVYDVMAYGGAAADGDVFFKAGR